MSDRNLTERGRAFEQVLSRLEQRVNRLNLHAWPGAVRSVRVPTFTSTTSSLQTVGSLTVTAGRWILHHRGSCCVEDGVAGMALNLRSSAVGNTILITPFTAGWAVGLSTIPFCDVGEFVAEENTTIDLGVYGAGFTVVRWTDLMLLAVPV